MRKLLLLVLLLVPLAALNFTVECGGSCLAYIPAGGNAVLNYSVNGSQLGDVFTQASQFNVTGEMQNTLLRVNLTAHSCTPPAAAFAGLDELESVLTEDYLLVKSGLSASNTTVKLFCGGSNYLRDRGSWGGYGALSRMTMENVSFNGSRAVISGLNFNNSFSHEPGTFHTTEIGRGNFSFVNITDSVVNISFYDLGFSLLNWTEIPMSVNWTYMAFGETTTPNGNDFVYVVSYSNNSYGNITLFNESFDPVATLDYNRTMGIALADTNGDSVREIVACLNTSAENGFNVTSLRYGGGGWIYNYTNISCIAYEVERFSSFERIRVSGANESVVSFSSSNLIVILFNETVEVQTTSLSGIEDIATLDADGDGEDEVVVAFTNGDVRMYNVSFPLAIQEIDYLGRFSGASDINYENEFLVESTNISLYSLNPLAESGKISYWFADSIPLKIGVNFTLGGNGNLTLNASSGDWNYSNKWSTSWADEELTLWPAGNGTLWVNFTLELNGTGLEQGPWLTVGGVETEFANSSFVNNSDYTEYTSSSLPITTTILADGTFNIVGANYSDLFALEYFIARVGSGNTSFQIDGPSHSTSMSKPVLNYTVSSYTVSPGSVQCSQSESNFSGIVGFREYFHLTGTGANMSTYGNVSDYCSMGNYFVYTWGNATAFEWNGTKLNALGNITGEFSECWLTGSEIYLVNSSGGLDIYNFTLDLIGSFSNANLLVEDVVVGDHVWATNGTHLANITGDEFTVMHEWSGRIFQSRNYFYGDTSNWGVTTNSTTVREHLTSDIDGDSLFEMLYQGVVGILGNIARILALPLGNYSYWGTNVSVAYENGTFETYDIELEAPRLGWFTSFSANTTHQNSWVAVNATEAFMINATVTKFIENSTDTVSGFRLFCINETNNNIRLNANMTKYGNHSFFLQSAALGGSEKLACTIHPTWTTQLPTTFSKHEFTLYSDSQAPVVNGASHRTKVSATNPFNITLNVTEDSEINQFVIIPDKYSVNVNSFTLIEDAAYKIFNVSVTVPDVTDVYPYNITFNISAADYSGKRSANLTTPNITVFNEHPPTIVLSPRNNNIQGYTSEPTNISITVTSDSGNQNNISYINSTLWQGSNLQSYQQTLNVDKVTHTLWFNRTFSGAGSYTVKVYAADMTGYVRESTLNLLRYDLQKTNISGYWWSSTYGTTEFGWEHEFTSGSITDEDEGSAVNNSKSFLLSVDNPNFDVDSWHIKNNASTSTTIKAKFFNSSFNIKQGLYYATNLYGMNLSSVSTLDSIMFSALGISVGSSEKLCFYTCDEFDLADGECDTAWIEERCGPTGDGTEYFTLDSSDDQLTYLIDGTGFKISKVAVEGSSTDEEEETQTTTVATPTSVITITTSTSKTIDVGSCGDVTYTIKNTGSASGTLEKITASNFDTDELTYTMLSDIDFPYVLPAGGQLTAILSFCPLVDRTFTPSVCVDVGSSNKCTSIRIYGRTPVNETEAEEGLNLTMSVEMFEDEYIVFVNSSGGPVQGATVSIIYPDGTSENFTTNVFGKVNFDPTNEDFIVRLFYGNETLQESIESLVGVASEGLTLPRILFDLLIVGLLMVLGIFLDEKML